MRAGHTHLAAALACITGASLPVADGVAQTTTQQVLEEVTVTARKRSESLQETPISVTAFSADELGERGARSFVDVLTFIPNVSTTNGLQIRGISYNQRNVGIEAGAGVYVDGVLTGRAQTFDQDLTDIERVEVLRGPQGTLFGKNSIAGAVNIVTRLPSPEFEGRALVDVGNQERRRGELMLNTPLGDAAALRVSGFYSGLGGYIRNMSDGEDYARHDSRGGRAALLIDPTSSLRVVLRADYLKELERTPWPESSRGEDSQRPPPRPIVAPGPYTTMFNLIPEQRRELKGISGTFEYQINERLSFTSITAYRENSDADRSDEDNSALDRISIDWMDEQQQTTQEFRLSGNVGTRVDYVAGLYYFQQDAFTQHTGNLGADFAIPIPGGFLVPPGMRKPITPRGDIDTESYAAFVDATISLTDRLDLLAGLRYTEEDKDIVFGINTSAAALPLFYPVPTATDSSSDSDLSPTVGLRFRISDELNTYAKYAKGFKSGGWNADFVSRAPGGTAPTVPSFYFEPEEAVAYEVGFKAELFDRRLRLNTAVFYTDYTNLQVAQFFGINLEDDGGALAVTANAGSATIKGVELEVAAQPSDALSISAGLGYQSAKYDDFANIDGVGGNASGREFAGVPKLTGNASVSYALPLQSSAQIKTRLDYSYRGSGYGDVQNTQRLETAGFGLVNARLGYVSPGERWEATLWARNLLDKEYVQSKANEAFAVVQSSPVTIYSYGRPRTYGLEIEVKF
jgi:iron complex outermembrane receptor protein